MSSLQRESNWCQWHSIEGQLSLVRSQIDFGDEPTIARSNLRTTWELFAEMCGSRQSLVGMLSGLVRGFLGSERATHGAESAFLGAAASPWEALIRFPLEEERASLSTKGAKSGSDGNQAEMVNQLSSRLTVCTLTGLRLTKIMNHRSEWEEGHLVPLRAR